MGSLWTYPPCILHYSKRFLNFYSSLCRENYEVEKQFEAFLLGKVIFLSDRLILKSLLIHSTIELSWQRHIMYIKGVPKFMQNLNYIEKVFFFFICNFFIQSSRTKDGVMCGPVDISDKWHIRTLLTGVHKCSDAALYFLLQGTGGCGLVALYRWLHMTSEKEIQ